MTIDPAPYIKPVKLDSNGEILSCQFAEDDIATEFTERHGPEWRYVAKWNRWYWWTGTHWAEDDRLKVFDIIRGLCRDVAISLHDPSINGNPKKVAARTVAGVHALARTDPHHAATVDQWDREPDLLGAKSRTIDLNSGLDKDPAPLDYITKRAAVDPGGDCPKWLAFLDRVTNGDTDLQAYLQRGCGYCLTGLTSEHVIFFLYGTGANGKSVFVETMSGVLGDYAVTAPMEMFVTSKNERHPTELARLRGARLVTATETETGQQWAEARIKALTGGDRIAARLMRQDFFEFTPAFKLVIAGNHRPSLRSVDEAMRRRIHLVPFTVTIPSAERDPDLKEKLRTEWPGILKWAIQGCLAWRESGLQPPQAVRDATDEYLSEEDALNAWIEEWCHVDPNHSAAPRDLFNSWKRYANETGETIGTEKVFSQGLVERRFERKRSHGKKRFLGIAPKPGYERTD